MKMAICKPRREAWNNLSLAARRRHQASLASDWLTTGVGHILTAGESRKYPSEKGSPGMEAAILLPT